MMSEVDGIQEQEQDSAFDIKAELQETQRALRETSLMIEQSQGEVSKLSQRNAAITSHLQQVQSARREWNYRLGYDDQH